LRSCASQWFRILPRAAGFIFKFPSKIAPNPESSHLRSPSQRFAFSAIRSWHHFF
jgi:hypothetical protein